MATMKKLMNEDYGSSAEVDTQTDHQRQMNHHSAQAMDMSRKSRAHAFHADSVQYDDAKGMHTELMRAYGTAAKAHLGLADHHAVAFKKERTDVVKDMTKTIQPSMTLGGKDGVK
jgi:hypothetical protein